MFTTLLQVALGGAIGASARYLGVLGVLRAWPAGGPAGTLLVNLVGSALMGALLVWLEARGGLRAAPFLLTGVLGGFTTFSAFSLDAFALYERGATGLAALYVLGSVVLSIAALAAGVFAMRGALA